MLNPSPRITELLENLGVLHLFKLAQGSLRLPPAGRSRAPTPLSTDQEEVTRACLEAHQTLMEINPDNVARFKDVTQFLAEDLKKLKRGRNSPAKLKSSARPFEPPSLVRVKRLQIPLLHQLLRNLTQKP